ncbi:MAG: hypothetical protein IKX22_04685 [Prevotella sp.]|nr:hypothetical protein [Prevotella sp.]
MKGKIEKSFVNDNLIEIDCIHIKNLFKAILEVRRNYFYYRTETNETIDDDDWQEQLERVFAYELYHQWSLIQMQYNDFLLKEGKRNDLLYINGEVGKGLEGIHKYPDMVLHGGQGDYVHQEIAVEIKRKANITSEKVIKDLEKLSDMITEGKMAFNAKPFKWGVFILTCGDVSDMKNILDSNSLDAIRDEVLCVFCKGDGILEYSTIDEIKYELL